MKSRPAGKIQTKLVTLAYGDKFSGKTTLGLNFAYFKRPNGKPFRLAVVDNEGGGVDDAIGELEDNGVDMRNIHVFYTSSLTEVKGLLDKIKNRETFYEYDENGNESEEEILDADGEPWFPDAIIIDGTSVLKLTSEQGLLELSKKRNTVKANKDNLVGAERFVKIQGSDLEFKDYKALNYSGQSLILDLMAIGINVYLTAREKDEVIQQKDNKGNQVSIHTGRKLIDSFKGIEYNCKTILHMFEDKETKQICAKVIKDRTKVHAAGEILEDPTLLDWQSVINKNKDKKEFILNNDLDKAVRAEQKMYEEEAMKISNEVIGNNDIEDDGLTQPNSSNTLDPDQLRAEINAHIKALSAPSKVEMKNKLKEKGLPVAFKSVKDTKVLQDVLDTIKG